MCVDVSGYANGANAQLSVTHNGGGASYQSGMTMGTVTQTVCADAPSGTEITFTATMTDSSSNGRPTVTKTASAWTVVSGPHPAILSISKGSERVRCNDGVTWCRTVIIVTNFNERASCTFVYHGDPPRFYEFSLSGQTVDSSGWGAENMYYGEGTYQLQCYVGGNEVSYSGYFPEET